MTEHAQLTIPGDSTPNYSVRTKGTPTVSFIVPCYKLGHLLAECIGSIRSQTFSDWELLIMDDCSPDNTAEVAKSFQDPRVIHVRNDQNLGLVKNFNKGISLSRGKYVWIISADDYLRRPYILERYVDLLETYPNVGYVYCPQVVVKNGQETEETHFYSERDCIINGRVFLKTLIFGNIVSTPATLARRECYEKIGVFPTAPVWAGEHLDFSWAQDWYLWCLFALSFDVGYFAEPMMCYREHDLSITSIITQQESVDRCMKAEMAVPWLVRERAQQCGFPQLGKNCLLAIVSAYVAHRLSKQYRSGTATMTEAQFEESLCRSTESERERNWIRARVFESMADKFFWRGDKSTARKFYLDALQKDWRMGKSVVKLLLLALGAPGDYVRSLRRDRRQH